MSKAYTPEFMGDPNPREKILKLARKITDCVDHKILGVTVNVRVLIRVKGCLCIGLGVC